MPKEQSPYSVHMNVPHARIAKDRYQRISKATVPSPVSNTRAAGYWKIWMESCVKCQTTSWRARYNVSRLPEKAPHIPLLNAVSTELSVMELSRTVSSESTRSWTPHLLAAGDGTPPTNRKARSSEPETGIGNVERSSVSMPPPASKAVPKQFPMRRLSKASDSGILDFLGAARNGSAVEETDSATPTLEAARAGYLASTLTLPDAHRPTRSEADLDSKRMSFSSLYSIGSAIYPANTRAMSGPGSIAGSEPEGQSSPRCSVPDFFLGRAGLTI